LSSVPSGTLPLVKQSNGERSAVQAIQNFQDLRKYFSEDFKGIGDLMKVANESRLRSSPFVISGARPPVGSIWRILK
jgi:hypothetical protein